MVKSIQHFWVKSEFMKKPILPRYFLNLISAIIFPTRLFGFKRWLYRQAGVNLAETVKITSECSIYGNGNITIGEGTWIGMGADFFVPEPAKVSIGERCDIAPRVRFLCGTHLTGDANRRAGIGTTGDIYIGSGVWIGAGSILLPNTYLADGIMVAAGSVVITGRYPANALLAGNPAQVKKIYES